jgi:hypothetical protein
MPYLVNVNSCNDYRKLGMQAGGSFINDPFNYEEVEENIEVKKDIDTEKEVDEEDIKYLKDLQKILSEDRSYTIKPDKNEPTFKKQQMVSVTDKPKNNPDTKHNNEQNTDKLNINQIKLNSYNNTYIPLISTHSFNKEKCNFVTSQTKYKGFEYINMMYKYDETNTNNLLIQTDFMDIKKGSITYKNGKIVIDKSLFSDQFLDIIKFFDSTGKSYFEKIKNKKISNPIIKTIINDKQHVYGTSGIKKPLYKSMKAHTINPQIIKLKPTKLSKYSNYNKIINYNISSKYPKIEYFNVTEMDEMNVKRLFNRIFNEKKELRMLIKPCLWSNMSTMCFGISLELICMEVKFKNSKINNSVLENNETSISNNIINISI